MSRHKFSRIVIQAAIERYIHAIMILPLIIAAIMLSDGYGIAPDSASYIDDEVIRSPLYPLFIQWVCMSFSEGYLYAIPIIQTIFFLVCFMVFMDLLAKVFLLPPIMKAIIITALIILFLDIFLYPAAILTESLSYGMFLLFVTCVVHYLLKGHRWRFLCYALILTTLMIITRKQFYFLYPFWGALAFFVTVTSRSFKKGSLILAGVLCSLLAAQLIERTHVYQKIRTFF